MKKYTKKDKIEIWEDKTGLVNISLVGNRVQLEVGNHTLIIHLKIDISDFVRLIVENNYKSIDNMTKEEFLKSNFVSREEDNCGNVQYMLRSYAKADELWDYIEAYKNEEVEKALMSLFEEDEFENLSQNEIETLETYSELRNIHTIGERYAIWKLVKNIINKQHAIKPKHKTKRL